jgi:hypothetical protein
MSNPTIDTNSANSGRTSPGSVNFDPSTNDISANITTSSNLIGMGATDAMGIGGIPEYNALGAAIKELTDSQVTLPNDLNKTIDNQALNELGASQANTALTGGKIAAAQRSILGDEVGQASVGGNLNNSRSAGVNALQQGNATATQASQGAGEQANSNTLAEAHNRLKQWVQMGQAYTANQQIQNTAQSFGTTLNNAQLNGIMTVAQDAQSGLGALTAAALANDQAQFGNLITGLRTGLAGLSGAASGLTNFLKTPNSQDVNEDYGNAAASTDDGEAATSPDGNDGIDTVSSGDTALG